MVSVTVTIYFANVRIKTFQIRIPRFLFAKNLSTESISGLTGPEYQ